MKWRISWCLMRVLYLTAKDMKPDDILYQEVFNCLPKEKQSVIIGRKADFAQKAGISL